MQRQIQKIIQEIWGDNPINEDIKLFINKVDECYKKEAFLFSAGEIENMHKVIVDSTNYAIIALDKDGIIKVFNKGAEKLLGYSASELIDKQTPEVFHEENDIKQKLKKFNIKERFFDIFIEATKKGEAYEDEWIYKHKDGHLFPVSLSVTTRKDANGEIVGFLGLASDITERKIAEQKLSESEERYRKFIESARDILYTTDENGNFTYVNEIVFEKIGYTQEEILGKHFTFLIKDDYKEEVTNFYYEEVALKRPFSYYEFPIVSKNGNILWVGQNVQMLFVDGNPVGTQAIVRDITNTKGAEMALLQSEERFRKLVQYSSDVTTILSIDGTIEYESSSFYRLFGYSQSLVGRNIFELIHPNDIQYVKEELHKGIEKGGVSDPIEFRFLSASGDWKYVEAIGNNLLNEPSINGIVVNSREISERKKAEKILANTNASLAAILESTNDTIFAIDKKYKYIGFNEAHKKVVKTMYGVDIHEGDLIVLKKEKRKHTEKALNYLEIGLNGKQFVTVDEYYNQFYETTYNPIRDEKDAVVGLAIFSKNITESKLAEQALLKAKDEAEAAAQTKADFLSNMSHEIRTPMNAIIGITDLLIQKEFEFESQQYLTSIKYSADNLLVIINDILDFSKIESGKITFEKIDFNLIEHIEELYKTFKYKIEEKDIEFTKVIDRNIPPIINGDPYRLNQILFNLVGNATKFTQKGFIKIKIELINKEDDKLWLQFIIEDSGIGIPKDKQDGLFESFTQAYTDTTRRFGGTGLGLAITKNLVVLQGGKITLHSIPNKGTSFIIEMPFNKTTTTTLKSPKMQDIKNKNLSGLRLLIVEDNVMNQFVVKQIIGKWNANIIIANNGTEAIEQLGKSDFDIVLMDLQMPEMSGYQAAEFIRSKSTTVKNPSIPIIALTADAFTETKRKVFEAGMNDFITKPFSQEELYSKIVKHTQEKNK